MRKEYISLSYLFAYDQEYFILLHAPIVKAFFIYDIVWLQGLLQLIESYS